MSSQSVDGKTLRRSYDRAAGRSPRHPVSAWAADASLASGGWPGRWRRRMGRDYALAWQSNAGTLRDDVPLFLDEPAAPMAQATQVNKGHGRIATRSASVSSDVA